MDVTFWIAVIIGSSLVGFLINLPVLLAARANERAAVIYERINDEERQAQLERRMAHFERAAERTARWAKEKAEQEQYWESKRWAFVRTYCPELEVDMSEPSVRELKRALALPQHQAVRDRLVGWAPDQSLEDPFANFPLALALCRLLDDSRLLPEPDDDYLGYSKDHVREACQAWLKELVDPQLPLELAVIETTSTSSCPTSFKQGE